MKKVLTDIMGTTVHNDFIKDLLAHFEQYGPEYITRDNPEATKIVDRIKREQGFDKGEQVISYVSTQIKKRNFDPDYMKLSGMVNQDGYEQGRLQAPFFEDVPRNLQKWRQNEKGIYVYSNGSPDDQEIIFRHTNQGDLTNLVDGYFGTGNFGSKYESDSYLRISDTLDTKPKEIAFLSDVKEELDAADKAGYEVVLVNRPGNKPVGQNDYTSVNSFDEIKV